MKTVLLAQAFLPVRVCPSRFLMPPHSSPPFLTIHKPCYKVSFCLSGGNHA
jgi:hypothetical protein